MCGGDCADGRLDGPPACADWAGRGRETPEEIALAILAEATAVLMAIRGGSCGIREGGFTDPATMIRNPNTKCKECQIPGPRRGLNHNNKYTIARAVVLDIWAFGFDKIEL